MKNGTNLISDRHGVHHVVIDVIRTTHVRALIASVSSVVSSSLAVRTPRVRFSALLFPTEFYISRIISLVDEIESCQSIGFTSEQVENNVRLHLYTGITRERNIFSTFISEGIHRRKSVGANDLKKCYFVFRSTNYDKS